MNSIHTFHTIHKASFNIISPFTPRFINYSLPSTDTALISSMRAKRFTNSNFFHFITQIPSDKYTQYRYNLCNILVPPHLYQPIIAITTSFFPFFNHKTHTTSLVISILLFLSESSYTCVYFFNNSFIGEFPQARIKKLQNTYLLTYLLTPWSRVLLDKLTG